MVEPGVVYLDALTLSALRSLLRQKALTEVILLEPPRRHHTAWRWLLKKRGVRIRVAEFFSGHLKAGDGESIRRVSRKTATQIAFAASRNIVQSDHTLRQINESYGRETIRLYIAKQLLPYIEYWTDRALAAQALCSPEQPHVWMKRPDRFDEAFLFNALPNIHFHLFSAGRVKGLRLLSLWLLDIARRFKLAFGFKRQGFASASWVSPSNKPSILMLQEDDIRADRTLRGQPHWMDAQKPRPPFDTYVLALFPILSIADDAVRLFETGLRILSPSTFRPALKEWRGHKALKRVRRDRHIAMRAVFLKRAFAAQYFLLRIAALLGLAEWMGALALYLNTKVFLVSETYQPFADAMQVVSADLGVTTIAYQYSNMGILSPTMMTTADQFLAFSDLYRAIYRADGIEPREFIPIGYPYDGVAELVRERAMKHRERLMRSGARFVVCYFDESVQNDRWGLVSQEDHRRELHALANLVLEDPSVGLVLKSQFIRNSPSRLYATDEIIKAAKSTGRYLELAEGQHRNDIYPTEAALSADLCISHKLGATAALEAALAGVRTVLLNPYGIKTIWDDLYAQVDIEYETAEQLLAAVSRYREGHDDQQTLGDWTPILPFFDPYRDGQWSCRLRTVLEMAIRRTTKGHQTFLWM